MFHPFPIRNAQTQQWRTNLINSLQVPSDALDLIEVTLQWPRPAVVPGMSRFLTFAANQAASNTKAHVTNNKSIFIKYTIETFFLLLDFGPYKKNHPLVADLYNKILDPSHQYTYTNLDQARRNQRSVFICWHRSYLDNKGIDLNVDNLTTDDMIPKMIGYFVRLLAYQDSKRAEMHQRFDREPKTFYPTPVHSVKKLRSTIDP